MDPDEVVAALWVECDRWSDLAASFQQLADAGFTEGSRAQLDTAAAAVIDPPPVVSHYVQERAWNTARMLRGLHRWVFDTEPGKLHLDATVMYPLMRAALEDTTTIMWLQEPSSRDERLTRGLRAIHQDALYFSKNHLLLAATALGHGALTAELGGKLDTHVRQEREDFRAHFADLAGRLRLDPRDVTAQLATSAPITAAYGDKSVERVTWGMLSDLSHFSYMMLRHLSTSPVPGSAVQLLHVTVLQFAQTLNRVSEDAIEALRRAAERSDDAEVV
ncbi:hypothetical protein M3147_12585 [Agromyces mediolanus]|uniref:hypothetical protein n=1 Tax=Agromyces mediolanus TaxID=41986 RepID=UPI0020422656|nr:hypothetical protein [Agromyces mediolanus]MCM3658086.1 hypothetical protein [Agromyces mediolanus]